MHISRSIFIFWGFTGISLHDLQTCPLLTTKWSNCHTHLVKNGEVTVRCEDVGQDAVTKVSVSDVTSRAHTCHICTHKHTNTHVNITRNSFHIPGLSEVCFLFVRQTLFRFEVLILMLRLNFCHLTCFL